MIRARFRPQSPAEHHAEALALLNDAADYGPNSAAHLALVTRAAAHAALALYRPPVEITFPTGAIVPDEEIPEPRRTARKKTTSRPKAETSKETTA